MPFHSQSTPESLLPRSDSKNPATTCKGITSNGRPCRRSLAQSPQTSPAASPLRGRGVLAVVPNMDGQGEGAAAFYCWQHKDQANALQGTADGDTEIVNLQTRTSTDSLAARLGVLTIEEEDGAGSRRAKRPKGSSRPIRRETLPQAWQNVPSPLISVTQDGKGSQSYSGHRQKRAHHRRRGDLHVSFFCCMGASDADHDAPVAPKPVPRRTKPPTERSPSRNPVVVSVTQPTVPPKHPKTPSPMSSPLAPSSQANGNAAESAYTQALLSFIPSSTDTITTKLLLAELSKPLTPSDREAGYIYIFWLTPQNTPRPAAADASTLLAVPSRPVQGRQASDILRTYSVKAPSSSTGKETRHLMLKIGRASNVTRRMTEWSRQCGHHITLLRYYPYQSNSRNSPLPSPGKAGSNPPPQPATAPAPQQVPLVARVERLIHVALQAQRVMRTCDGCGKTHREWFEVEASKEGIRRVDATVKRWVEWGLEEGKP